MYNKKIKLCIHKALGYVYFCDREHPLADITGFVYYHRHMASIREHRWLSSNEVVHHIDGNRQNNDPLNLSVTTKSGHCRLHREIENKGCEFCQRTFRPVNSKMRFCSPPCAYLSSRKIILSKEDLERMVHEKPITHIANEIEVSDVAIHKLCKKLKITKLPRGYWSKRNARIA